MERTRYTTIHRSLDRDSLPMRLYEKAKRYGHWNPSELDFSQDVQDWQTFSPEERDLVLRLSAMFQAGEEAVTLDLLPLIQVIAAEGRLEEEIFLTTFLYDEAKHTDFFRRFLDEVVGDQGDLERYHTPSYRVVFYVALPAALQNLRDDPSPATQARAATTYNMIVEGVLAESGYYAYHRALETKGLLPGVREGVIHLRRDESRHLAYGLYLLSRLIAADASLWEVVEETMNALLTPAVGMIGEAFSHYDPIPFGVNEEEFIGYAMGQFQKRFERLERARGASQGDVVREALAHIEAEDA